MTDIDPFQFRHLLGHFATGVTVLTTLGGDGHPVGMTASSLASVSLNPPLLSVCVDRSAEMHAAIVTADRFVVNILAAHQEAVSRRFADWPEDRFDGVGYTPSEHGIPLIDGALAHIECERHALLDGGDHTIVLGRVVGGAAHSGRPLLYYRGGYAVTG